MRKILLFGMMILSCSLFSQTIQIFTDSVTNIFIYNGEEYQSQDFRPTVWLFELDKSQLVVSSKEKNITIGDLIISSGRLPEFNATSGTEIGSESWIKWSFARIKNIPTLVEYFYDGDENVILYRIHKSSIQSIGY